MTWLDQLRAIGVNLFAFPELVLPEAEQPKFWQAVAKLVDARDVFALQRESMSNFNRKIAEQSVFTLVKQELVKVRDLPKYIIDFTLKEYANNIQNQLFGHNNFRQACIISQCKSLFSEMILSHIWPRMKSGRNRLPFYFCGEVWQSDEENAANSNYNNTMDDAKKRD
jgi:hypothetical protein